MAKPTVVLSDLKNGDRNTNSITTNEEFVDVNTRGNTSLVNNGTAGPSGLETLRKRFRTEGFSEESSNLLLESRRSGTKVAYAGPWKKWGSWCSKRKIDPLQATVGQIAAFLTTQFHRGLEYSTVNAYRSAISAFHPNIEGCPVGQHPRIKQLLKGVFNRKPPAPRYSMTWNVDDVLRYIKHMGPNKTLDMKQLSLKLAMLMALTSVSRGSELAKLNPQLMNDAGDHITFQIAGLTKTKRQNKPHLSFNFHSYSNDETLDVVQCLR